MKLFRTYTYTQGDKSITERLVAAATESEARANALNNVKAQNGSKGLTSIEESKGNTVILSIRECGDEGVLCTNRIPVASLIEINNQLFNQESLDFKSDMARLAGMSEEVSYEELTTVLSAMLNDEKVSDLVGS